MASDHLARMRAKQGLATPAAVPPDAIREIPPLPPKPAKHPQKIEAVPPVKEQIKYQCGHVIGLASFCGQQCPACKNASRIARAANKREKRIAKQSQRINDKGRLPDGSRFDVVYDAATETWSGHLFVPGRDPIHGKAGGVFRLLPALHDTLIASGVLAETIATVKAEASGIDMRDFEARR